MIVTDIQRFSTHDGPGIRTTVFLKGCNLHCRWCHNPETISPLRQIQFIPQRCIACGACLAACPNGCHATVDGRRVFRRDRCAVCGACAAACYARALTVVGREMSVEQVFAEVLADLPFYESSGGGVTVSGGEPLAQLDEMIELLARCRARGIHTAVETNLAWPWERVEKLLPVLDLMMADVKHADPAEHARWTGAGNENVLANLARLGRKGTGGKGTGSSEKGTGKSKGDRHLFSHDEKRSQSPLPVPFLIVRTPVIVGVNATAEAIGAIADLLAGMDNLLYYELLPYHPLGMGKYEALGLECPCDGLAAPDAATLAALADAARRRDIRVRSG